MVSAMPPPARTTRATPATLPASAALLPPTSTAPLTASQMASAMAKAHAQIQTCLSAQLNDLSLSVMLFLQNQFNA